LTREGKQIPYDIRKGVWVVLEADTEYLKNCFEEYKVVTDPSGKYMTLYKRWHMIGLELAVSVASVAIRAEATGAAICFNADCAAVAKRDIAVGEILDGEGGYTVSGGLRPAVSSVRQGNVPLGLAHNVPLIRPVKAGATITWDDINIDRTTDAYRLRTQMEEQLLK
jgi:predicted homoserine dehydrogenase-like protein